MNAAVQPKGEIYPYDPDNVPYLEHLFKSSGSRMAKRQSTQTWFVTVEEEEGTFTMHSGKLGGKITQKVTKVKPKNVGRANETTVAEQAHIEAKAKWVKKVQRDLYKRDLNDGMAPLYLSPMLAMDATKNPHRIDWANRAYMSQPKLNGVRVVAIKREDGTVDLQSREGVFYNVQHIKDALAPVMSAGTALDGELDLGNEYELGDVTGALKPGTKNHHLLRYALFDVVHDSAIAQVRYAALCKLYERFPKGSPVDLVPAHVVVSAEDMDAQHDALADAGYEGIMVRDKHGLYDYGYKGVSMFKFKKFQDQEFLVVGVTEDKDGGGLFLLKTDNSEYCDKDNQFEGAVTEPSFTCRPKGTDAMRADILANPDDYIGKLLTVRFSEKLKSGVPEFNRGITKDGAIAVRDYE